MSDGQIMPTGGAAYVDVGALADALRTVFAPMFELVTQGLANIKTDVDQKHAENREARHSYANKVDTSIGQLGEEQIKMRERLAVAEYKLTLTVGPDGNAGELKAMKQGQEEMNKKLSQIDASVSSLEKVMPELLTMAKTVQSNESARQGKRDAGNQIDAWLRRGLAACGGATALYGLLHWIGRH